MLSLVSHVDTEKQNRVFEKTGLGGKAKMKQ
jgi:hypothetical protein